MLKAQLRLLYLTDHINYNELLFTSSTIHKRNRLISPQKNKQLQFLFSLWYSDLNVEYHLPNKLRFNKSSQFLTAVQRYTALKELIKHIVQSLVDHPEQVAISEVEGKQITVLEVKVAKEDLGKIIGKQGQNAKAIRTILNAASAKTNKRTIMEIIE